jgi:hypothetical protein
MKIIFMLAGDFKLVNLTLSPAVFSSAKILGDFFLQNTAGEENFPTRLTA